MQTFSISGNAKRGTIVGDMPERHSTGERLDFAVDGLAQFLKLPQDDLRSSIENPACRRRCDAGHRALEQFDLQFVFEHCQLLAQRGLGNASDRSGTGNAAAVDDLHEVSQSTAVHDGCSLERHRVIIRRGYAGSQRRYFPSLRVLATMVDRMLGAFVVSIQ